jgi:glutamine amidotransferase-like uncharacterized protein
MNKTKTILIYNDADSKTCSAELSLALRNTFKHCDNVAIVHSDRHHLVRNINELNPDIIVLPEIKGEESFYSRHIPIETRNRIKSQVENGSMLVSFCAGAYWMAEQITYHPPKGITKMRDGVHVFNAAAIKAFGPVSGYWRSSNGKEDLGGCIPVPLRVNTVDGTQNETVWHGNGPAFYPLKNKLPENIEILAEYSDVEEYPIAAFALRHGQGQYLASGPLAHYHRAPVRPNNYLWSVITHRMHQHLFAKPKVDMVCVPA